MIMEMFMALVRMIMIVNMVVVVMCVAVAIMIVRMVIGRLRYSGRDELGIVFLRGMVAVLHGGVARIGRRSLIGRVVVMHIALAVRLNAFPLLLLPLCLLLKLLRRFRARQVCGNE